jgi:hypothetical protein
MGRLHRQVKTSRSHFITENVRGMKRIPGGLEDVSGTNENSVEASNRPLQMDYPRSRPHWSCKSLHGCKSK